MYFFIGLKYKDRPSGLKGRKALVQAKRKKRSQTKFNSVFIVIAVFSLCFGVMVQVMNLNKKSKEYDEKIAVLNEQVAFEEARKDELDKQYKYMQTKAYVEDVAHEKLNLVYPDEIFIRSNDD